MNILMVCTGNICRSPTAEGMLRHYLAEAGLADHVRVDSAGTHDYHIGNPPDSRSIRHAHGAGVDISGLRARQVSRADFQNFDLLLAMDGGHLQALHHMAPPALRARAKLYLDFAPAQPLRDMPDPYYGNADGFDLVIRLCHAGSNGLLAHIRQTLGR
ncbi:low molecular weight protein-tyrosine-phosphatase [Ferrovibrio sp.]|uniref:low molecular weight protein-tyrosine-phosphatase n=1 Tax=Ferrovibrio sp. TaxID=1917215 RepID=UPI003D0CB1AB